MGGDGRGGEESGFDGEDEGLDGGGEVGHCWWWVVDVA